MRKWIGVLSLVALVGCSGPAPKQETRAEEPKPTMTKAAFGKLKTGEEVDIYTLKNAKGAEAKITNYGGIIVSLRMPDRNRKFAEVTHGFDTLEGYTAEHPYFGALIGRYGNRIAKGSFTLNGKRYKLPVNNNGNTLHGGLRGFDKVVWTAKQLATDDPSLELSYVSKDGEEGFPGTLTTTVRYTLTNDSSLRIDYKASTDKDTVLNLTNHAYFNLSDDQSSSNANHELRIDAEHFLPVNSTLIPTGELKPVEGTPFDFRKAKKVGAQIEAADEQIKLGGGYDHNFVLNGTPGTLRRVAELYEPTSGRVMEVETTEPGVQFYTGNFLDGTLKGKDGKTYGRRSALCLETQHYPDSPNQPKFPTTVLKAGEEYNSTTVYRFMTR
jgi:aldose 1-epimerase